MAEPVKEELEVLVEDDEFEEFEEGTTCGATLVNMTDWEEDQQRDKEDPTLWEDDWDDEDVEDDFSAQLRYNLYFRPSHH
jgi:26 proteasome complex subunit DSS1